MSDDKAELAVELNEALKRNVLEFLFVLRANCDGLPHSATFFEVDFVLKTLGIEMIFVRVEPIEENTRHEKGEE